MTGFKPGDRVFHRGLLRNGTVTTSAGPLTIVAWDDGSQTTAVSTDYLEPLGEPMSTTFKSTMTDRTLTVGVHHDSPHIAIESTATAADGFFYAAADAPALALAILEAAGVEAVPFDEAPETEAGHAAWVLRHHVQASDEAAKEAADQKELETEALTLCRVMWDNSDQQWEPMSPKAKAMWLVMARTAREMHNR